MNMSSKVFNEYLTSKLEILPVYGKYVLCTYIKPKKTT